MGTVHAKMGVPHNIGNPYEGEKKPVELHGINARVDRVNVQGLARTKDDIIRFAINDLFLAENFEDMIKRAHLVRERLQTLQCFSKINVFIDTSTGANATPNGYEVTYSVKELRRINGGITTHVSNNEGLVSINLASPNLLGRGEQLKGEYTFGSRKSKTFDLSYVKPYFYFNDAVTTLSMYQNNSDYPPSGYKTVNRGLRFDLAMKFKGLKNNFQWVGDWRELSAGSRFADFAVREQSGMSLKSALRHIVTWDRRDSPLFPSSGNLLRLDSELAGLGGNVSFLKTEVDIQYNVPVIGEDVVFQASLNAGVMHSFGGPSAICDRFFLGGPMSVRGFDYRGIGPKAGDCFTGGTMFYSGALHIYSPLPFRPGNGGFGDLFRTHLFINGGNIGNFTKDDPTQFIEEQKKTARASCGVGVALRLGNVARVELNYCIPLLYSETDRVVSGVQFGVGIRFL